MVLLLQEYILSTQMPYLHIAFHLLLHHRLQEHKMMTRSHQNSVPVVENTPQAPQVIPNTLDSVPVIEKHPTCTPSHPKHFRQCSCHRKHPTCTPSHPKHFRQCSCHRKHPTCTPSHPKHFRQCSCHTKHPTGTPNAIPAHAFHLLLHHRLQEHKMMTRSHQTVL